MNGSGSARCETRPVAVAHLVTGAHLHGYGSLADGREFAVRTRDGTARLEVYRLHARQPVPAAEDLELVNERPVRGVDLDDERSVRALVADMAASAGPPGSVPTTVVRAVVGALGRFDPPPGR
ncbi:MAG: hypothetical protein ACRDRZ_05060 [Pseudonocardiaceae bacterium]